MSNNALIIWEYQKKRVCQYYECSDGRDKQYPECEGVYPKRCQLERFLRVIEYLNKQAWPHEIEMQKEFDDILNPKSCKHKKTVCINEEGNAGVFCADCGEQLEKEC